MSRLAALAHVLTFAAGAAFAQSKGKDRAQLDSVSVHIFLTKSGTLSDDVTAMEKFAAWNFSPDGTGIPPGEKFYSMLIRVKFTSNGEVFAKGQQAELVVTDRRTRKIVKREKFSGVYIGPHGWTYLPVFIEDGACGPFEIVASAPGKRITKSLEMACGE